MSEVPAAWTPRSPEETWHASWQVTTDEYTRFLCPDFDGTSEHPAAAPNPIKLDLESLPVDFELAVVVGSSGTGKSNLLADLANHYSIQAKSALHFPRNQAVVSHPALGGVGSALDCLGSCGFNRVPSWNKPFGVLSNGEGARTCIAISLRCASQSGCVIDDFGATVDEKVAASMAYSISKMVSRRKMRRVIVGTSKFGVLRWLRPDFVISASTGEIRSNPFAQRDLRVVYHFPSLQYVGGERSSGWKGDLDSGRISLEPSGEAIGSFGRKCRSLPWATVKKSVTCEVIPDEVTAEVANAFEFQFDGTSTSTVFSLTDAALAKAPFSRFVLAAIVGPSGTGKSTLLRQLGSSTICGGWCCDKAVCSQLGTRSPVEVADLLKAVNLPLRCALRPFHVLSASERERAEVARTLFAALSEKTSNTPLCLDEFTSSLDRESAKRMCLGIAAYLRRAHTTPNASSCGIVVATIHEDILQWLAPDWVLHSKRGRVFDFDGSVPKAEDLEKLQDTSSSSVVKLDEEAIRALLTPPQLDLTLRPLDQVGSTKISRQIYEEVFAEHHYLTGTLPAMFGLLVRDSSGMPVAFHSVSQLAGAGMGNITLREARFVVLPEYQGLGLVRLSDIIGEVLLSSGMRFFSKTAHPRLGNYRDNSMLWKASSTNHKATKETLSSSFAWRRSTTAVAAVEKEEKARKCFSHKFVGKEQGDGNDSLIPKGPSTTRYAVEARSKRKRKAEEMTPAATQNVLAMLSAPSTPDPRSSPNDIVLTPDEKSSRP